MVLMYQLMMEGEFGAMVESYLERGNRSTWKKLSHVTPSATSPTWSALGLIPGIHHGHGMATNCHGYDIFNTMINNVVLFRSQYRDTRNISQM
jgi:hypothetical protein